MKKTLIALVAFALSLATKATDYNKWMADLPDSAPVCVVSIPGTHDTATGNGLGNIVYNGTTTSFTGASYARTQDLSLSEQLAIGIRAFDFRPCTTKSGGLNINHGVVQTNLNFQTAMETLCAFLDENPTEFFVIHLLHEDDGDAGSYDYETLLHSYLDTYDDYISEWRRDLTVGEMRGKMVFLFRDSYTSAPKGGLMTNWKGYVDWSAQTTGRITGRGTGLTSSGALYMQDLSNTAYDGGIDDKVAALQTMLDYSTQHYEYNQWRNVWVYNFASAYSQTTTLNLIVTKLTLSLADGYRENAGYTNQAITDYLTASDYVPGPTGIILSDYVGVDTSNSIATNGIDVVNAIIANNFKYITEYAREENDITLQLGAYDASDGTEQWTTSNIGTMSGEHWSGDPSDAYFEMSSSLWSSASKWTATMTQTLTVPDGTYRLTAAGRSSTVARVKISLNGTEYTFPAAGNSGGDLGNGWSYGSVEANTADGTLVITATLYNTSATQYQWASIDDFKLEYIGALEEETEDEALTALAASGRVSLTMASTGSKYCGNPVSFYNGTNTTSGNYGFNIKQETDSNAGQAFTLKATGDLNTYTMSFTDVEGETRYICTGTAYGLKATVLRTTLDPTLAVAFKFEASDEVEGAYLITNVEAGTNIGVTSTTSLVSTGAKYMDFTLATVEPVSVTVTPTDGWATLCLPFATDVPDECTAYSCTAVGETGVMTLIEESTLLANTPYVVSLASPLTFEGYGTYYSTYSLTSGLLTGTMADTTPDEGAYALASNGVFLPATADVPAHQAYITTDASLEAIYVNDKAAGISVPTMANEQADTYDLSGRRVSAPTKGIYIKGGIKIVR